MIISIIISFISSLLKSFKSFWYSLYTKHFSMSNICLFLLPYLKHKHDKTVLLLYFVSKIFPVQNCFYIRLIESNYISYIFILDQPHRTNFTVAKVSNTSEGNCTIFNFKAESTKCKQTHNIYIFNSMELFIYQLLNQSSEEIKICNDSYLFDNIKYAKAQSVWMGETSYQLRNFVSVLEGKTKFFPNFFYLYTVFMLLLI